MAQTIDELMTVEKQASVQVLRFHHAELFDTIEVELIATQFEELAAEGENPRLVLDLELVEHVSSVMLSALIEVRSQVLERGGRIALASIQPRLRDLLDLVRIHDLFENYASVESAVVAMLD